MTRKTVNFDVNPLFNGPSLGARARGGSPFRFVPLSDIDVDPDQPRRVFSSESIAELAASISEYGVLSPVLVRPTEGGTYRLVAGERRLRACKLLGLDTIPAIVDAEDAKEGDTLAKQLVENIQREDLTSMERALAIGQLRERFSLSVRDIAIRLGISKSVVQRSVEILNLPDDLQAALIAGASESKILLLSQVHDRTQRKLLLEQLDDLSRSQIEILVAGLTEPNRARAKLSHGGTVSGSPQIALSAADQRVLEEIRVALGLKVHLLRSAQKAGQGKLVLEFYSDDDLGELLRRLTE